MNIVVKQGQIEATEADTLIVNLFDDVKTPSGATGAVDKALDGAISELIASGDLTGKLGEVGVLYSRGAIPAGRILVVGLGKRDNFNLESVRQASASAIKKARSLNGKNIATIVHGAGIASLPAGDTAQATTEASLLALYQYRTPRGQTKRTLTSLTLIENDPSKLNDIQNGATSGQAIASGTLLTRDLVNKPANIATPTHLADTAQAIADDHNMDITIGGRDWASEHNMGAFLAVAQGAGEPPKFIVLKHNSDRTDLDTLILVGKGITFDTGGISIKPSANMGAMKTDMGGAGAVLGAMKAVGMLNIPLRVIGITPCTENMPDAHAYRPADVITASNGKTIEIISTDAEGRMALADALVYAQRYNPTAVIDLATLTGTAVAAMGKGVAASVFSTADWLTDQLVAAGQATHERVWPFPLWPDYRKSIDSDTADMKNSGGRMGGLGTSAVFLQEFTDYTWAHLDIAGVAAINKAKGYIPAGATGYGVRLLIHLLRNWQNPNK